MRSRKRVATFQLWELDATTTASARFPVTALHQHHADVVPRADEKEEGPEDPAAPARLEKALSELLLLHKETHGCHNNQRRSCGKVGPGRLSAEDLTTLVALLSCASFATRSDTRLENVPTAALVVPKPKGLSIVRHVHMRLVAAKNIQEATVKRCQPNVLLAPLANNCLTLSEHTTTTTICWINITIALLTALAKPRILNLSLSEPVTGSLTNMVF